MLAKTAELLRLGPRERDGFEAVPFDEAEKDSGAQPERRGQFPLSTPPPCSSPYGSDSHARDKLGLDLNVNPLRSTHHSGLGTPLITSATPPRLLVKLKSAVLGVQRGVGSRRKRLDPCLACSSASSRGCWRSARGRCWSRTTCGTWSGDVAASQLLHAHTGLCVTSNTMCVQA